MNVYSEKISTVIGVIGTGLTWALGTWDIAIMVLLMFMALDYTLGLIKGKVHRNLNSKTGFKGLAKKSAIFVVLIVAVCLDRLIGNGTWVFRTLVCYFYIANEGLSILENCSQIGIKVPVQIKDALEQLRDKEE
nr:phage holin family protein [Clostridioides sp.]